MTSAERPDAAPAERSTREILEDHLALTREGDVETDLQRNFTDDCILLTSFGSFRGHEGVRAATEVMARQLPQARFEYRKMLCHDDVAFVEWAASSAGARVDAGANTFVMRGGRIAVMTIHYTLA